MTEQEVWEQATKIWEKREKAELTEIRVCLRGSKSKIYIYDTYPCISYSQGKVLQTKPQVRRFLDGLEEKSTTWQTCQYLHVTQPTYICSNDGEPLEWCRECKACKF